MLLSLMIFIPLIGMVAVLLLPRESEELIKRVTLLFTLIPLALAVYLFISYDRSNGERSTFTVLFLGLRHSTSNITLGLMDSA